jgi:citrate lyase subunit beta/citryl-CoA lyase
MKRSLLFIPGHRPAQMQTADLLKADGIVFDLEDAVDPLEKASARELVVHFLSTLKQPAFSTVVRVNAVDTPFFEADLKALKTVAPNFLMIPKATIDTIKIVAHQTTIPLIALVETARGLVDVDQIAASGLVCGIALGAEDYRLDMRIERQADASELAYARSRIAVACKAFDLFAVDTPWIDTYDDAGLKADAKRAKAQGFRGKLCIHPSQVEIVHEVFSPSADEIKKAKRIVEAWNLKQKEGVGVFRFENKMIDKPVAMQSFAILEEARQSGWRDPDAQR